MAALGTGLGHAAQRSERLVRELDRSSRFSALRRFACEIRYVLLGLDGLLDRIFVNRVSSARLAVNSLSFNAVNLAMTAWVSQ